MSSIVELAKNLHGAAKAAGVTNLTIDRFTARSGTKSGSTRYEGTATGTSRPASGALHGVHHASFGLFFWCISKLPQEALLAELKAELARLNKEPGENDG